MATTTIFSMLSNLVYSFVLMQAEILAYLRPAQFLVGRLLKKNRAHVLFTVRFPASAAVFDTAAPHLEKHAGAVLQILKGIGKQNSNFHVVKAVVLKDGETGRFEAWYLSNTLKWVDVVDMTLLPTASKYWDRCMYLRVYDDMFHLKISFLQPYNLADGVMIEARSCSTSIVPASVPFAPLLAPCLWWLPFDDHYQNYVGPSQARLKQAHYLTHIYSNTTTLPP